ncbi:MAG: recombinase family protein [Planctomycetota bacterium]|jgi:DNA invertase Pin-like site-specific DNA recombinase
MKTEAVGYCRVSSVGQQKTGTGLDRQEQTIRAYAKQAGYKLLQVYHEAFTGTENDRPVFELMIADLLDNGCRVIICECLDRLARDLSVQLQIIALLANKGITLINAMTGQDVTTPTDPMSLAMIQVQGAFAQLDKNLLVRKLKKGRQTKKEKAGSCEGRKPYGYYPGESEILARIKQLHRKMKYEKRLGPYEIATILNKENLPNRKGTKWHGATVRRIIERLGWHTD